MAIQYGDFTKLQELQEQFKLYLELKSEYGSEGVSPLIAKAEHLLQQLLEQAKQLPEDAALKQREPDDYTAIAAARTAGVRSMLERLDRSTLHSRMAGAVFGRFCACILGVPVECDTIPRMEDIAKISGTPFPPTEYWHGTLDSSRIQYDCSPKSAFCLDTLEYCPSDDDIVYTIVGLLILEQYGFDFTTEDVAAFWKEHLGFVAFTAELAVLHNLHDGVEPQDAADVNNPYVQYIGAMIRSDPWAFACPAQPERAAQLAYRDAYLTHRRNGIYGEMFFAAAQAAAFAAKDAREALEIALCEIPKDSLLYSDIRWSLDTPVSDWREARRLVDERFAGMNMVHTNNNACLTVFALLLCGDDFTKLASEVVAMGLDNDCTAASAGSIFGALHGIDAIPERWYKPFHNRLQTYIKGHPWFRLDDVVNRFVALAEQGLDSAHD